MYICIRIFFCTFLNLNDYNHFFTSFFLIFFSFLNNNCKMYKIYKEQFTSTFYTDIHFRVKILYRCVYVYVCLTFISSNIIFDVCIGSFGFRLSICFSHLCMYVCICICIFTCMTSYVYLLYLCICIFLSRRRTSMYSNVLFYFL